MSVKNGFISDKDVRDLNELFIILSYLYFSMILNVPANIPFIDHSFVIHNPTQTLLQARAAISVLCAGKKQH